MPRRTAARQQSSSAWAIFRERYITRSDPLPSAALTSPRSRAVLCVAPRLECRPACDHLVRHHAKGEDIRAGVGWKTLDLLRRHIRRCSSLRGRRLIGITQFRYTEVE